MIKYLVAVMVILTVSCTGPTTDREALEAMLDTAAKASTDGDVAGYAAVFTDAALEEDFGLPREDFLAMPADEFAEPISITSIEALEIDGDSAEADVTVAFGDGGSLFKARMYFTKVDGEWLFAHGPGYEPLPVAVPTGVTAVEIDMADFAYVLGDTTLAAPQAFQFTNVGDQEHEAILVQMLNGITVDEVLRSVDQPDDAKHMGWTFAAVGEGSTMVFADPLPEGRYALFCFVQDPQSEMPHAEIGMTAEFTVGSA